MEIIFEDSEDAPISKLFKASYLGKHIHFSGSNKRIYSKWSELKKNFSEDTRFIIYVDMVPDNKNTVYIFESLQIAFQNEKNVTIVPIICAEFVAFRMLTLFGYLKEYRKAHVLFDNFLLHTIESFNYSENPYNKYGKNGNSLEKYCKSVMNRHADCIKNRNSIDKDTNSGKFYLTDCQCSICELSTTCIRDNIAAKAEKLYVSLPIFWTISKEHIETIKSYNIQFQSKETSEILERIDMFYSNICSSMGIVKNFKIKE